MNIKELLKEEHPGFSGLTHWLIAVFIFLMLWLTPWEFASQYVAAISSSIGFTFLIFFVIGGASLLPDLDSSPLQGGGSAAIYQLGFLGNLLSMLCITISGVVYSIVHTRYDDKPKSQHRMLFHAPIIPILIFVYVQFLMPSGNEKLWGNFNLDTLPIIILIFFCGISIYLGSNMLIYRLLKLFHRQSYTQFICLAIMIISVIYMLNIPTSELKLIGFSLAFGYFIHIISDLLTKGSAPLFFPIPIPNKKGKLRFWWKPYLFGSRFAITTGGVLNIVLNFALFGINIFLVWFIFFK